MLICSRYAPYDTVAHAGGKTHNFYLKQLKMNHEFNIHLITFANQNDLEKLDLDKYNISHTVVPERSKCSSLYGKIIKRIVNKTYRFFSITGQCGLTAPYIKYMLYRELMRLKRDNYSPDIIELNWTEMALYFPIISKIFPDAKYCAVEQDVTFLRFEREYKNTTNFFRRRLMKFRYEYIKKKEKALLSKFDMAFTFSQKDKDILNGLNNVELITPYFQKISFPLDNSLKKIILFYGAMHRHENYLSAIWFIENVFPHLSDLDLTFVILGSNPHQDLYKYQNHNILITGYQENILVWFQKALCLVAPLKLGAGIKIKIVEGLSAGVPILCSDVASEGIDINDTVEYFRCISAADYVEKIRLLYNDPRIGFMIGNNAKSFIDKTFNLDQSVVFFTNKLKTLVPLKNPSEGL
jgi:glycosyltransferase involved in cell wall biosynthesis